ncbi:MAG: hypothetical protein Q9227_005813 [Pyrenula ochraceoflavens]
MDDVLEYCHHSLPNGLVLNSTNYNGTSGYVASSGYLSPVRPVDYGNPLLSFSMIRAPPPPPVHPGLKAAENISASQCFLYWCVNDYEGSKIDNGHYVESITRSWYSNVNKPVELSSSEANFSLVPPALNATSHRSAFLVGYAEADDMSSWLAEKLTYTQSVRIPDTPDDFDGDIYPDASNNQSANDGDTIAVDMIQMFVNQGPIPLFPRISKSLTKYVRSVTPSQQAYRSNGYPVNWTGVGTVNGTTHYDEVFVSVRWPWLTFPATLIALTVLFLALTIAGTARSDVAAWKSSPIPLLFHGLAPAEAKQFSTLKDVVKMETLARGMQVRLQDDGNGSLRLEESRVERR